MRPEDGRSAIVAAASAIAAMRLGRLDAETTANVGTIEGGTAINVVPERCRVEAEVRSLDADRAAAVATEMVDHLQDAANAGECDLDVDRRADVPRLSHQAARAAAGGRRAGAARLRLRAAARSSPAAPRTPTRSRSPGFACTCLADGTERNHEPGERVSAQALESMLEIALALVDEAAAELGDGVRR